MTSELEDPWFVYVVECADGSRYTGVARDVAKRVGQHNEGKGAKYTRGRGPVRVLVESPALARGDALRLEAKAKRLKGDAKLGAVKDGKKSLEPGEEE